jgi:hypothetical protein
MTDQIIEGGRERTRLFVNNGREGGQKCRARDGSMTGAREWNDRSIRQG